jgi:hypothetical protein
MGLSKYFESNVDSEVRAMLASSFNDAWAAGVRFQYNPAVTNPVGERVGWAAGKVCTPGIGVAGTSDFDSHPLFLWRTCNKVNGVVTNYFGEPGFSVANDTFVEIPAGYSRIDVDDNYITFWASHVPFTGASRHQLFSENGVTVDKQYLASYKSSYDGSSKHESKSGTFPDVIISRSTARTRSTARGAKASLQDVYARDWFNLISMIELGQRDEQTAVGRGYVDCAYSATHVATVAESSVNRIIIANAFADLFIVGQEISIGTSPGSNGIAADRTITAIDVYDGANKAITFNDGLVNIDIGNVVWTSRQKTGKTDGIGQGTGRANAVNGKGSVRYRGIEDPWGNVWEWVDNLNINNNQGYADIMRRRSAFSDSYLNANYTALSAALPATNNYFVKPLICRTTGLSCLPATVGGASTQYFCDYYYQASGERAACVGGGCDYGSNDGLWCWSLSWAASYAIVIFGARLLETL